MVSFVSDYIAGAHPKVLEKLVATNLETMSGYSTDSYCASAKAKIKAACECPDAEVFFLVGGTQTNQVVISTMLNDYEGVIAATTGHVSVHEAGAIEYSGHKVLELPGNEGKLNAETVDRYIAEFYENESYEHMVFPGMVYISYPTEYGTLYSKKELEDIYAVCKKRNIPLYVDGARLAYGLCSKACDITLPELAKLCDVFYIGGTKCGALCGEAVVFTHANAPKHFMTMVKQRGAMLAKGRLLGVQFDALFTDDLYFEIGRHAIELAERLKEVFRKGGYGFLYESPTNQQFVILKNDEMDKIAKKVAFEVWEKYDDDHTVVRFATSWSTTDDDICDLIDVLVNLKFQR